MTTTLTDEQATAIQARADAFAAWLNGRTSWRPEEVPAHLNRPTNEETSALEVHHFASWPHPDYFAYLSDDGKRLTTFMGDELATVTQSSVAHGCNFGGGDRTYFRAVDSQGRHWYGSSPGRNMYARMRRAKRTAR